MLGSSKKHLQIKTDQHTNRIKEIYASSKDPLLCMLCQRFRLCRFSGLYGEGGGSICSTYLQTLLIKMIKVVGGQTCLVALLLLLTLLPVDDSGFLMTGHIETKGLTAHSLSK